MKDTAADLNQKIPALPDEEPKEPIYNTFQDLINNVDFDKVVEVLETEYPEKLIFLNDFRAAYEKLLAMTPTKDNPDFLHIESDKDIQSAFGEDYVTGEKYGIEFCSWSDWLSFRLKPEQVSEAGKTAYAAVCLTILTSYGFTEEDIQRQFDLLKSDTIINGKTVEINSQDLLRFEPVTLERSLEKISGYKNKLISDMAGRNEENTGRPWVRFWARMIDSSTIILLISFVLLYFVPMSKYVIAYLGSTFFSIIKYFIWAFIEALFISRLGWTPGKWILNIRVLNRDGSKLNYAQALNRTLQVLLHGEGLFIPVISFITNIIAYSTLKRSGMTKWDRKLDVTVTHGKIQPYRIIMAAVIIPGVPLVISWFFIKILLFTAGSR